MDLREYFDDAEERIRLQHASLMSEYWFANIGMVSEDTKDGHVATLIPTTKRRILDPVTRQVSYEDHPTHPDAPIHYTGGGGVTATHPVKQGDEGIIVYAARAMDAWHQNGGSQQPIDARLHSLRDASYIPGVRSTPRKLQQVSNAAHHVRSDDKKHVAETHPQNGITHKSVDPSTAPASESFDPFKQASKFYQHAVQGASGVVGQATDGGTTHDHGVTHGDGAFMRVANALHTILAHPTNGASMNALNMLHSVLAHPSKGAMLSAQNGQHTVTASPGGVQLNSSSGISLSAPSVSLPSGSIGGGALKAGAASSNIGALTGDVGGTLPNATVLGLGNVNTANTLPMAANDAAAAALGVVVGGLYLNTSFVLAGAVSGTTSGTSSTTTLPPSNIAVLCARMV